MPCIKKWICVLPTFQNIPSKIVLLIIPNREGWSYLAVKKLSALLRQKTSKNNGDFYCLNCFHSLEEKTNVAHIKKHVKINVFVTLWCVFEDTKILEFNQHHKSDKTPLINYADLECLIKKIDKCKNNPEKSMCNSWWA